MSDDRLTRLQIQLDVLTGVRAELDRANALDGFDLALDEIATGLSPSITRLRAYIAAAKGRTFHGKAGGQ